MASHSGMEHWGDSGGEISSNSTLNSDYPIYDGRFDFSGGSHPSQQYPPSNPGFDSYGTPLPHLHPRNSTQALTAHVGVQFTAGEFNTINSLGPPPSSNQFSEFFLAGVGSGQHSGGERFRDAHIAVRDFEYTESGTNLPQNYNNNYTEISSANFSGAITPQPIYPGTVHEHPQQFHHPPSNHSTSTHEQLQQGLTLPSSYPNPASGYGHTTYQQPQQNLHARSSDPNTTPGYEHTTHQQPQQFHHFPSSNFNITDDQIQTSNLDDHSSIASAQIESYQSSGPSESSEPTAATIPILPEPPTISCPFAHYGCHEPGKRFPDTTEAKNAFRKHLRTHTVGRKYFVCRCHLNLGITVTPRQKQVKYLNESHGYTARAKGTRPCGLYELYPAQFSCPWNGCGQNFGTTDPLGSLDNLWKWLFHVNDCFMQWAHITPNLHFQTSSFFTWTAQFNITRCQKAGDPQEILAGGKRGRDGRPCRDSINLIDRTATDFLQTSDT